jgi:type VI secretion system protein ImpA
VHPALRQGVPPAEAALRRLSALSQLDDNEEGVMRDLKRKVIVTAGSFGTARGTELAKGALDARTILSKEPGLSAGEQAIRTKQHEEFLGRLYSICADWADKNRPAIIALIDDVQTARAALDQLDSAIDAHVPNRTPIAPDLKRFLQRVVTTLERHGSPKAMANGAKAPQTSAPQQAPSVAPVALNGAGAVHETLAVQAAAFPDRLTSRDDVVKCLDLIVGFYDRTEPSSPIPHLARRVRRMVHMDFVELMEDLAPSGLKEFRLLAGAPEGKKTAQKE